MLALPKRPGCKREAEKGRVHPVRLVEAGERAASFGPILNATVRQSPQQLCPRFALCIPDAALDCTLHGFVSGQGEPYSAVSKPHRVRGGKRYSGLVLPSSFLKPDRPETQAVRAEDRSLRLVCLSDTHGLHRRVEVPDGDILIHAGDMTVFGRPPADSLALLADVNAWLGGLPHSHKVVIAGNHDVVFEREPDAARGLLTNAHYLQNSGITLEGLRFWGSPASLVSAPMAFAAAPGEEARRIWGRIPEATDVLVTHGPPYGTCDQAKPWSRHQGCLQLNAAVQTVVPRLHVFGHIHGGYGREANRAGTLFVNCAVVNHERLLVNAPVVVDLAVGDAERRG